MSSTPIRYQTMREGEDAWFAERLENPSGTAYAAFTAFTTYDVRVYDRTSATPGTPVYSALAVAGLSPPLFDVLQTDGFWEGRDSTGYNFRYRIPPATFRFVGGKIYDVEFKLTGTFLAAAIIKTVVFQVSVLPVGSP